MSPLYSEVGDRAKTNAYSIWPFINTALSDPENYGDTANMIIEVAEIDTDFRSFLEKQGWITL